MENAIPQRIPLGHEEAETLYMINVLNRTQGLNGYDVTFLSKNLGKSITATRQLVNRLERKHYITKLKIGKKVSFEIDFVNICTEVQSAQLYLELKNAPKAQPDLIDEYDLIDEKRFIDHVVKKKIMSKAQAEHIVDLGIRVGYIQRVLLTNIRAGIRIITELSYLQRLVSGGKRNEKNIID
ncbi:MAG: hypothetical protein JSV33_02240 [bacterium]|nr:MAG: hypothetical protein JSV33_02240 [bacterium]